MRGPNGLTAPTASAAGTPVKSPSLRKHPTSKPLRRKRPTSSHNGDQSSRKPRSAEPLKCRWFLSTCGKSVEGTLKRRKGSFDSPLERRSSVGSNLFAQPSSRQE